jgi:protein FrlC
VASIGYDGVEIGAASPHAWPQYLDQKRREEIKNLLGEVGIKVSSICPGLGGGPGLNPASYLEVERKASIQYYKDCVDLASDLQSSLVLYVGGWRNYGTAKEQAWEWSRAALTDCAHYAADRGVTFAVEANSSDCDIIETADDIARMIDETGLSNVKAMFDTCHAWYRNDPLVDYVKKLGKDLVHIHIEGPVVSSERQAPGAGGKDLKHLLIALKRNGFNGYLTQESGLFSRSTDPDEFALQGYLNLTAMLKEIESLV